MDLIENLRAFRAVARHKSFSLAASELDVVPSVISKRIGQLEGVIGSTLIQRSSRHVSLTEDGVRNLATICELLENFDLSWNRIKQGDGDLAGKLRIGIPTSLGFLSVGRLMWEFSTQHPGLSVEVLLRDGPLDPRQEQVDVSITAHPDSFDGAADEVLWRMDRTLLASSSYLAKSKPIEHPRDLQGHRCLVFLPTGASWDFYKKSKKTCVSVQTAYASNNMADLLFATLQGGGVAILSNYILSQEHAGHLERLMKDYDIPPLWVKALIRREMVAAPRVRKLLDFLKTKGLPNMGSVDAVRRGHPRHQQSPLDGLFAV